MNASDKPSRVVVVNPQLTLEVFETWTRARDAIEKISQETDVQAISVLYLNWLRGNALAFVAGFAKYNIPPQGRVGLVCELKDATDST